MGKQYTFIDLFAGIGGFHIALHELGLKCVFASEIDKFARQTYESNFRTISPELFDQGHFNVDINKEDPKDIPNFDVLCAGFPCQPFSIAGLRKGFEDTRGTLFFNIANIVNYKKNIEKKAPKILFLENVKGLKIHNGGKTFSTILSTLDELGYSHNQMVLNAKNFGVPQNRERLIIIAWDKEQIAKQDFTFPLGLDEKDEPIFDKSKLKDFVKKTKLGDILDPNPDSKYTISDKLYAGHLRRRKMNKEKGNGFGFSLFTPGSIYTSTISARYYKDGSEIMIAQENKNPRKLTPQEAGRLQGFPIGKTFNIVVSDVQAYKQFGNSVAIPLMKAVANEIVKQLLKD
jgi:DNA (cytosine-5)-methyltransferase 1